VPPITNPAASQVWRRVSKYALTPDTPFAVHKLVAAAVFRDWDEATLGPHALWFPHPAAAARTNLARFMAAHPDLLLSHEGGEPPSGLAQAYDRLHAASVDAPQRFWPPVLRELRVGWHVPPRGVLELRGGDPDAAVWFPGARLNIAHAALTGRDPDAAAIVWAAEGEPCRCLRVGG